MRPGPTDRIRSQARFVDVAAAMQRHDGVATRRMLLRDLPRHAVDGAVRRGRVIAWLPGVLADPVLIDEPRRRWRAALLYAGGRGLLTHTSALVARRLLTSVPDGVDHISVPAGVRLKGGRHLVVHESSNLEARGDLRADGLAVASPAAAVVTSWPLLPPGTAREAAILAVRDRLVAPEQLAALTDQHTRLAGRAELLRLCGLLALGAHSEFEIWGLAEFLPPDLLARSQAQFPIRARGRTFFADRGFEEEKVAYELDGIRWYDRPQQRERDRQRDAAVASEGWQTLRVSWRRAHRDPRGCIDELRQVLAVRRRQLGLPPR